MPLAPQKEQGARVTHEIRNPMGWVVGRTRRLALLLEIPEIQEMVQRVVEHLDSFCAVEQIEPNDLSGNVMPTRALRYITIALGARACWACDGTGLQKNTQATYCTVCQGTGVR